MLAQLTAIPKNVVDITLLMDDHSKKEVSLRTGLFGTFKYLKNSVVTTTTGEVIFVSIPPLAMPQWDDSTGIISAQNPGDLSDIRYFIIVKTQYGINRIQLNVILDIDTIFESTRPVSSPDDNTQISIIRNNNGIIEVSQDGSTFTAISALPATVTADINTLKAQVAALQAAATPTDPGTTTTGN